GRFRAKKVVSLLHQLLVLTPLFPKHRNEPQPAHEQSHQQAHPDSLVAHITTDLSCAFCSDAPSASWASPESTPLARPTTPDPANQSRTPSASPLPGDRTPSRSRP